MTGMLNAEAHNENPNHYEEALHSDLVPYGELKIEPGHPYYEEA